MKLSAVVFLLATWGLAGYAIAQDGHVALIKSVSGSVKVVRNNVDLPATAGMSLRVADRVVSKAGASGGIVFKDGTLLTIGAGTDIAIRDYVFEPKDSNYAFSVYLAMGTAIYSSGRIGKLAPETVSVSTPSSTVGVRGTRFIVRAE